MPPAEFHRALAQREPLRAGGTNAFRLLDGRGDGALFDGLYLEDYAGRWLVQTDGRGCRRPPEWLREAGARSIYWKELAQADRQGPQLWHGAPVEAPFEVREEGVAFQIDFSSGYSQGIFLDQRLNRARVRQLAAQGEVRTMLNLFAYTCGFSVCAAVGGAVTTSVDLSRRYLDWGRTNFTLNGVDPDKHEFLSGDVFEWLRRLGKKGRRFDLVVVDPPTFSRDRDGRVFRVERDAAALAQSAARLLAPNGRLFFSSNSRGFSPGELRRILQSALAERRRFESIPMPPDFCGAPYLQAVWAQ
ncbi:MAG: class I SAM-dependent rRNA methyltransferase [Verrucomicrobia bacterium]|nr:class I SAM-dependent rRNA methyltransferase [Verrucomicrobiota bacterium]